MIRAIQANRVFRLLSSVKLAVPLMFLLLLSAAAGTVFESQYSAEIATARVYRSSWFLVLLTLLWLNIFSATLSRLPFKKHHVGFVITHIGLLTLLAGGMMTAMLGIDGQLRVVQGSSDNEVFLQNRVIRVEGDRGALGSASFSHVLKPLSGASLDPLNDSVASGFTIDRYEPFVAVERGFSQAGGDSGQWAVRFGMKSQFFEVTEWLDTSNRPELQLGPATLRLVVDSRGSRQKPVPVQKAERKVAGGVLLRIKSVQGGNVLAEVPLSRLKKTAEEVGPVKVSLTRAMEEAVVAGGGKIEDRGTPGKNPALELKVEHQGQSVREVVFSRFPTFSLRPEGAFGLRFEYVTPGVPAAEAAGSHASNESSVAPAARAGSSRAGNVIEFHVSDRESSPVRVELYKNGKGVLKQIAREGEPVQTPWMGMRLTLVSARQGVREVEDVRPVTLEPRSQVPPSAIRVRTPASSEGIWIVEGDRKRIETANGPRSIYFGPESIRLPFAIQLDQFSKVDYPGTETALSYESRVRVNGEGEPITIAMNEPLKRDGFTLYQSSYVLEPGQPPVSVFSVNQDPGRPVKYIGSLILVFGIAIFTIMRSRWYLKRSKHGGAHA